MNTLRNIFAAIGVIAVLFWFAKFTLILSLLSSNVPSARPTRMIIAAPMPGEGGTVTLKAAIGQTQVQMFDDTDANANVIGSFADGTPCEKLSGPKNVTIDNVFMVFYILKCNGTTGYVNERWIAK